VLRLVLVLVRRILEAYVRRRVGAPRKADGHATQHHVLRRVLLLRVCRGSKGVGSGSGVQT
tara:strand:- start:88 stop:270 length:183 start_codon:yes stop_codon:yes gene_type:complete